MMGVLGLAAVGFVIGGVYEVFRARRAHAQLCLTSPAADPERPSVSPVFLVRERPCR